MIRKDFSAGRGRRLIFPGSSLDGIAGMFQNHGLSRPPGTPAAKSPNSDRGKIPVDTWLYDNAWYLTPAYRLIPVAEG
ncbi:hypothetical protein HYU13_01950 [Candidatus Woesearchaeota archaeon]|nr:hypothetical protein [Candidatus Woesearchaeota archaeon]